MQWTGRILTCRCWKTLWLNPDSRSRDCGWEGSREYNGSADYVEWPRLLLVSSRSPVSLEPVSWERKPSVRMCHSIFGCIDVHVNFPYLIFWDFDVSEILSCGQVLQLYREQRHLRCSFCSGRIVVSACRLLLYLNRLWSSEVLIRTAGTKYICCYTDQAASTT